MSPKPKPSEIFLYPEHIHLVEMYRNNRGASTPVGYVFILLLVVATAAGSLYVVDSTSSSLSNPSPETASFDVDRHVDGNYSLIYTGEMALTVDNTAAIAVTDQENTTVLKPKNWEAEVNTGDKLIHNISKKTNFSVGERIQIIHYESGAIIDNSTVDSEKSGEVIEELTVRQSDEKTLRKIKTGNFSEIGDGNNNDGNDGNDNNNTNATGNVSFSVA